MSLEDIDSLTEKETGASGHTDDHKKIVRGLKGLQSDKISIKEAPLSPYRFGYTGLAGVDETAAIQATLTSSMSTSNGSIYLPPGEIIVSNLSMDFATLPIQPAAGPPYGYSGPKIFGAGKRQTTLKQKSGSTGVLLTIKGRTGTQAGAANNNKISGIQLSDIELVGTSTGSHNLWLQSIVDSSFTSINSRNSGGSGIYCARQTFVEGINDEYFFGVEFSKLKLTANGRCGFETDGVSSISGLIMASEAQGNAMDGYRIAPSNFTLINTNSFGNGSSSSNYRGFRFLRNSNTASQNNGLTMVGCRAEGNSTAGGYEIEIETGSGHTLIGCSYYATTGAHGIGVGTRAYGAAGYTNGLNLVGGYFCGDKTTSGQKAIILGSDARDTRITNPRFDFPSYLGSPGAPGPIISDLGSLSSFDVSRFVRTTVGGSVEVLTQGSGLVLPGPTGGRYKVGINASGALEVTAL